VYKFKKLKKRPRPKGRKSQRERLPDRPSLRWEENIETDPNYTRRSLGVDWIKVTPDKF
jgi:hypothetical protein